MKTTFDIPAGTVNSMMQPGNGTFETVYNNIPNATNTSYTTTEDGYYYLESYTNSSTAYSIVLVMFDNTLDINNQLSGIRLPAMAYNRATTSPIYLKKGVTVGIYADSAGARRLNRLT